MEGYHALQWDLPNQDHKPVSKLLIQRIFVPALEPKNLQARRFKCSKFLISLMFFNNLQALQRDHQDK